jgi:hypothetical protein
VQGEEGIQLESCDPQDCASHAYYAHAHVQHVGYHERTWKEGKRKEQQCQKRREFRARKKAKSNSKPQPSTEKLEKNEP